MGTIPKFCSLVKRTLVKKKKKEEVGCCRTRQMETGRFLRLTGFQFVLIY
jgi:hypothetical protein